MITLVSGWLQLAASMSMRKLTSTLKLNIDFSNRYLNDVIAAVSKYLFDPECAVNDRHETVTTGNAV